MVKIKPVAPTGIDSVRIWLDNAYLIGNMGGKESRNVTDNVHMWSVQWSVYWMTPVGVWGQGYDPPVSASLFVFFTLTPFIHLNRIALLKTASIRLSFSDTWPAITMPVVSERFIFFTFSRYKVAVTVRFLEVSWITVFYPEKYMDRIHHNR